MKRIVSSPQKLLITFYSFASFGCHRVYQTGGGYQFVLNTGQPHGLLITRRRELYQPQVFGLITACGVSFTLATAHLLLPKTL
jgi:hypothetical protein